MFSELMIELESLKNDNLKNIYLKHGCDIECLGVKISDLKLLIKKYKIKNNNGIAIQLYNSKIYDAMYLGGLIIDSKTIDKKYILEFSEISNFYYSQLAYIMSEHPEHEYFLKHFKSIDDDKSQAIYYCILSGLLVMNPDYNQELVEQELDRTESTILKERNSTKYQMNSFVATVGVQKQNLQSRCIEIYNSYINEIDVHLGDTSCKLTNVVKHIEGANSRGRVGVARKSPRC